MMHFRGIVRALSSPTLRLATNRGSSQVSSGVSITAKRCYAQSWDNNRPNKDIEAHLKVQGLLDEIQSHPNVASKLRAVSEIMVSKGLANDSAPPGPWQVVKILTDKDVRQAMAEFKEELAKSGIELGPEQLEPLMAVLGMEKK